MPKGIPGSSPPCSIPDCDELAQSRGWCNRHYHRWRRYGDPLGGGPFISRRRDPICSVKDCGRPQHARGWCNLHHGRWRRLGSVSLPEHQPQRCSLIGCERAARKRSWCTKHYQRWRAHGDPCYQPPTPEERFWAKVNKQGPIPEYRPDLGPCWPWEGATSSRYGHGQFWDGSRLAPAHRYAYELLVGQIPEGLEPDHLCRNPPCVRPIADEFGFAHLEPVTHQENILRGYQARRAR